MEGFKMYEEINNIFSSKDISDFVIFIFFIIILLCIYAIYRL